MRARAKKLNAAKWTFLTFLAIIAGWFIGALIMVIILLIRYPELMTFVNRPGITPAEIAPVLAERMNPLVADIFLLFCGMGGYLLVRYLLMRKPEPPADDGLPEGF